MKTCDMSSTLATNVEHRCLSQQERAMVMFEANKKEVGVAYVLWLFLGYFGGHNFYLKRPGIAMSQLLLTLSGAGLVVTFFWHLADAFLIPGRVRRENSLRALMFGVTGLAR